MIIIGSAPRFARPPRIEVSKQLDVEARAGEYNRADAERERLRRYARRLEERRTAHPGVVVHNRGIIYNELLFGERSAALGYQLHPAPRQRLRVPGGVRYRRGAADEGRARAVEFADAREAAEKIREMRAEDAAVGVQLVYDDVFEILEIVGPFRVVGEDAGVQHVGVRDYDVSLGAREAALHRLSVAVVDETVNLAVRERRKLAELRELVPARAPSSGTDKARAPKDYAAPRAATGRL